MIHDFKKFQIIVYQLKVTYGTLDSDNEQMSKLLNSNKVLGPFSTITEIESPSPTVVSRLFDNLIPKMVVPKDLHPSILSLLRTSEFAQTGLFVLHIHISIVVHSTPSDTYLV